jgi:hypothetical protein
LCLDVTNSLDLILARASENSSELVDCLKLSNVHFAYRSENCSTCLWIADCKNCSNCIGCIGIENKEYYILNTSVDREEFERVYNNFNKYEKDIKNRFDSLYKKYNFPLKNTSSEDCIGDNLISSK